ncbi:MAG: Fumble domain-containing protein [Dehalococcoidia bacterium]
MLVVADLGGSNTDLLLADETGAVVRSTVCAPLALSERRPLLDELLTPLGASAHEITAIVVTGGRHRRIGETLAGTPIRHVDEIEAIGFGGLLAAEVPRALVVSMGTGTAFVSAEPDRIAHAAGVALGGGTLRGLANRLLGTADHTTIAALAEQGNPRGADLTVADIVDGDVGILPGDMPAAYFARLLDGDPSPSDIAAGILDMIGHIAAHMALLTARLHGHDTVVLVGHMLEFPAVVRAARRFQYALGGTFIVPPEPGFAVARGALAIATRTV